LRCATLSGRWPADEPRRILYGAEKNISLDGHDLIVVQTKASRLGMYLMGQALFSCELIKQHFSPRSVRAAVCGADDLVLHPIANRYGIEVFVDDLGRAAEMS
jgi:hypothetical protein